MQCLGTKYIILLCFLGSRAAGIPRLDGRPTGSVRAGVLVVGLCALIFGIANPKVVLVVTMVMIQLLYTILAVRMLPRFAPY